jgi:hypothetical protein
MKKTNSDESIFGKKKIISTFIFEIIGKPPEYLLETLEDLIKQMNEEKGVKVVNKKINEPVIMQENKEFYTTFAEVDLEVEEISQLVIIMFKYMPAHIEILEPNEIELSNNGWTDILSELTRRLHGYDEIAKVMQLQNTQLQRQLKEAMSNRLSPGLAVSSNLIPNKDSDEKEVKDKPSKNKKK